MKKIIAQTAAVVIFMMASIIHLSAQTIPAGTYAGSVKGSTGKPIFVTVVVSGADGGATITFNQTFEGTVMCNSTLHLKDVTASGTVFNYTGDGSKSDCTMGEVFKITHTDPASKMLVLQKGESPLTFPLELQN